MIKTMNASIPGTLLDNYENSFKQAINFIKAILLPLPIIQHRRSHNILLQIVP